MTTESLSFSLRPVANCEDLLRACKVRAQAYGHKDPAYLRSMLHPDAIDASPSTTVFICEDKVTGQAVGTMRIQTTTRGQEQLEIEKYVVAPPEMELHGRGEITRLASPVGADPFVRLALWKAGYLFCMASQVRWLMMGVRKPSLLRAYEKMGAIDIYDDRRAIPLAYAGNLPHRILALDIGACDQRWRQENHPLLHFMVGTVHPDISVLPSVNRYASKQVRLQVVQ